MRQLSLLSLSLTFGLVLACKSEDPVLPVSIVKFDVDSAQIQTGGQVTISWETQNAASVQIVATPPGTPLPNVSGNAGSIKSEALFEPTTFQLTATGDDGTRVSSDAKRVDVRGIRIQTLTATPNNIDPGQSSTIEWTIGGDTPTEVVLLDDMGMELFSGSDATGSTSVMPTATTVYTLRVTAESGTDEETVTVMVADIPPRIVSFEARPNPVAIGMMTSLSWETVGAFEIQVLQDGVVVRPWNRTGTSVSRPVPAASVEFTLQARTESLMMTEQTIIVTGLEVPIIDSMTLTPADYSGASTQATVTWSATFTDSTALTVNGTPVPGFPATAAGEFDFTVSGGTANVVLTAINGVGQDSEGRQVLAGFLEPEPNDTATTAIALTGDGVPVRGTITAADTDVYAVMVPAGARISATVGWDGTTCSFDTVLDLYASDRTTLLGRVDDTQIPALTPCSRINPAAEEWADDLAAGTYYLHVRGSTTAAAPTGTYSLSVEVTGPEVMLPGVTLNPVGEPTWNVVDVVQLSILIGNGNTNPPFRFLDQTFSELLLPLYAIEGFLGSDNGATVHPIFRPVEPNERDYDGVLSALVAINGYESKTTFTRTEFEADNAILLLFVLEPGAGAPTESSYDFELGPVLPTELFPMSMDWNVVKDAMPWYEANPLELLGYHQYDPPVFGSGSSHRITGVVIIDALAPGADPIGTYDQTFEILEPGGAGWTVTVPLTVTP